MYTQRSWGMGLVATAFLACVAVVSYRAGAKTANAESMHFASVARPVNSNRVADIRLGATKDSRRAALATIAGGVAGMVAGGPAQAFEGSAVKECTNPVACGPVNGQTRYVPPADYVAPAKDEDSMSMMKFAPLVFIGSFGLSVAFAKVKELLGADEAKKEQKEKMDALRSSPEYAQNVSVEVIQAGDGETFPTIGNMVEVHYTGTLTDGTKFDSSRDRNQTFKFPIGVGRVIKGWDTAVIGMSKGERATITIQSDWAYGSRGSGPIPGGSVLIFDVELIDCQ